MLETPHVALGIAIASKIPNPIIAIPLAFASHFLLEGVPHWNPHLNSETKKYGRPTKKSTIIVAIDVFLSLTLGIYFAYRAIDNPLQSINILACSFAAVLPDVIEGPYFFFGMRNKAIEKWIKFQKSLQTDVSILPGLATQILTILAILYWII